MPRSLDCAADFADDGGTPAFRAREAERRTSQLSPLWFAARLAWLIPALAPLGAFAFAGLWFACGIALGAGTIPAPLLVAVAAVLALRCLPRGALSATSLKLTRSTHAAVNRGDVAAPLARTYVGTVYGATPSPSGPP